MWGFSFCLSSCILWLSDISWHVCDAENISVINHIPISYITFVHHNVHLMQMSTAIICLHVHVTDTTTRKWLQWKALQISIRC